jgi:hypothetical protein
MTFNPTIARLVTQMVLTAVLLALYGAAMYAFLAGLIHVDPDLLETFKTLLSVITGSVLTSMNFWFMSSSSSQAKDEKRE